ncbi:MAG: replication-associated recombination protein A, partial [Bacteroidota bacterium]
LNRAIAEDEWLKTKSITLAETAALLRLADGDARSILNLLELTAEAAEGTDITITDESVMSAAQTKAVMYDKKGEMHYDIISAFIKSLRGSDPNGAIYWMARMIAGGEDPKFIARRMLILASEDIGNANPTAMMMATGCFQAVTYVGYPEAEIILSQTAAYLAASPKSNASYMAIRQAAGLVQQHGNLPVPMSLRNAPTRLMKQEGYGKGYKYSHDFPENFAHQEFMPEALAGTKLYDPGKNAREDELRTRLKRLWGEKYGY